MAWLAMQFLQLAVSVGIYFILFAPFSSSSLCSLCTPWKAPVSERFQLSQSFSEEEKIWHKCNQSNNIETFLPKMKILNFPFINAQVTRVTDIFLVSFEIIFLRIIFILLRWTYSIVGPQCAWQPADNSLKLPPLLLLLHSLVLPGKSPTWFIQISNKI